MSVTHTLLCPTANRPLARAGHAKGARVPDRGTIRPRRATAGCVLKGTVRRLGHNHLTGLHAFANDVRTRYALDVGSHDIKGYAQSLSVIFGVLDRERVNTTNHSGGASVHPLSAQLVFGRAGKKRQLDIAILRKTPKESRHSLAILKSSSGRRRGVLDRHSHPIHRNGSKHTGSGFRVRGLGITSCYKQRDQKRCERKRAEASGSVHIGHKGFR